MTLQNFTLGTFAQQGLAVGTFESIATTVVGAGGSSSVVFSSISADYAHLQLRVFAQTNRGTYGRDAILVRFNSDTGSNYSRHDLVGDGSSVTSGGTANATSIYGNEVTTSTAGASIFGVMILDLLDYKDTNKYKTARLLGGGDHNGTVAGLGAQVSLNSGGWRSTSAVNSITLFPYIGTRFNQYSHFALYGIKAA